MQESLQEHFQPQHEMHAKQGSTEHTVNLQGLSLPTPMHFGLPTFFHLHTPELCGGRKKGKNALGRHDVESMHVQVGPKKTPTQFPTLNPQGKLTKHFP